MILIKECHMDFCATMISCTWFVFWLCNPASASCAPPPPVFSSLWWSPVLCSFSSGMCSYEKVRFKSTTQQEAQVFSSSLVWSVVQRFLIQGYFHPLRVNSLLCLDFSFSFLQAGSEALQGFLPNSIQREKDHFKCLLCTSRIAQDTGSSNQVSSVRMNLQIMDFKM